MRLRPSDAGDRGTKLHGYFDFTLTFSAEDLEAIMDPAHVANLTPPEPTAAPTGLVEGTRIEIEKSRRVG
jgi:hypothetical protein